MLANRSTSHRLRFESLVNPIGSGFSEKELDRTQDWERYRVNADTKIVGKPDAAIERLSDKLIQLGVVSRKRGDFEKHGGQVQVFAEAILDDIMFRGMAKIAVNFLAHLKGTEFILRPDFDAIRDYVRLGVRPALPPVIITKIPILHGDDAFYRQTNGHVIVLSWNKENEGMVCLVSLQFFFPVASHSVDSEFKTSEHFTDI